LKLNLFFAQKVNRTFFLLTIPLALSLFTHLWNPVGFPPFDADEGVYIRRALHILNGLGPLESGTDNLNPWFGPMFLAAVFKMIGYPDSLNPSPHLHSIEMVLAVPRILMGILVVVDTFLVYKISERQYNRNVAFIASVLFAVMPMTWLLRLVLLDSILLPFLLLSVLFAVSFNPKKIRDTRHFDKKKEYSNYPIFRHLFGTSDIYKNSSVYNDTIDWFSCI